MSRFRSDRLVYVLHLVLQTQKKQETHGNQGMADTHTFPVMHGDETELQKQADAIRTQAKDVYRHGDDIGHLSRL